MNILKRIFGFGKSNKATIAVDADEYVNLQQHLKASLARARRDKKATRSWEKALSISNNMKLRAEL